MSHTEAEKEAYWQNRSAGVRGQATIGGAPRRVVTVQIQHIEPLQAKYPEVFTDERIMAAYNNRSRFIVEHEGAVFYLSKNVVKHYKLKGKA